MIYYILIIELLFHSICLLNLFVFLFPQIYKHISETFTDIEELWTLYNPEFSQ